MLLKSAGIALKSLLLGIILAGAAVADIKKFNAAMNVGDYKAAAAAAEVAWKTWDRSDPDTALIAREFGFASLIAGRNDLALQFGKFLVEDGNTLTKPDDQPLTSAVLYRAADYKQNSNAEKRLALRVALNARMTAPGIDMISVLSWEALYNADWDNGDWDGAIEDATNAAEFLGRNKSLLARQRRAELHAASTEFVKARGRQTQSRNDLYSKVADVHDRIVDDIAAASSKTTEAELWSVKWKAETWAIAIESYVNSTYQQVGSLVNSSLKPRPLIQPTFTQYPDSAPLPLCEGEFVGSPLRYPESKRFRGMGSMILRLETGADGRVSKVAVLGVIPDENFISNIVATIQTWTYKAAPDADRSTCGLESRNHLYKASFRLL